MPSKQESATGATVLGGSPAPPFHSQSQSTAGRDEGLPSGPALGFAALLLQTSEGGDLPGDYIHPKEGLCEGG